MCLPVPGTEYLISINQQITEIIWIWIPELRHTMSQPRLSLSAHEMAFSLLETSLIPEVLLERYNGKTGRQAVWNDLI